MRTRTSLLRTAPGSFEIVEVDLAPPRTGEVLVRLAAAGLCHSDDHLQRGDIRTTLPLAGGHEGAGVVVEVGPEVHDLAEGDHVVLTPAPSCGRCRFCARGQQYLCGLGDIASARSHLDDGTNTRISLDGVPVSQMAGLSALSEYTTVDARSCIKIPEDVPLRIACLVGCGVGAGWGSAVHSAEVRPGHTVIVMGVGGVGIHAVQGAAYAGARVLIAVDPTPLKREAALAMGATQATETMDEARELAREATNGQGADSTIVAVGHTTGAHLAEGFAALRKGGTLVVTGFGHDGAVGIPVPLGELIMYQKRIQGSWHGGCSPIIDVPLQLDLYRRGQLKLDELVTATYTLDDITRGYDDMRTGKNIRGVVLFD